MTDTYTIEKLQLDRPLVVFDIEATGINRKTDKIIDLGMVFLRPDGSQESMVYRVNPGMPIPAEAIAIHGITDEDVKDCPSFEDIAEHIAELLEGCDLAGYNLIHYDIPMLQEAFLRADVPFQLKGRRVLDAQKIFHKKEPRDLTAAVSFYCGDSHAGAHGALADAVATLRVLDGQLKHYPDLPTDMDALDEFCNPRNPDFVDRAGRIKWQDGVAVINFSKNKGRSLKELAEQDAGFLKWILKNDFPLDTRNIVEAALQGNYPEPPGP